MRHACVVVLGGSMRRQRERRPCGDSRAQLVRVEERLLGTEDRPLDVALQLLVALLDQLPRRVERLERTGDHNEQRVVAQVVEQRRRRLEEQRQVVLDARRQLRVGDRPVHRTTARLDREVLAEAFAKRLDRRLVERKLAGGQDLDLVGTPGRELRLRVERPQRFDLVVEKIDAHRCGAAGREHVEHGAAHRELAGLGDLLDAQVAVRAQPLRHLRRIERVARREVQRARDDELRRRQALEQGARLENQGLGVAAGEPIERHEPIGEQVLRRRDRLVRQRLVIGEAAQAAPAEECQLAFELVGLGRRRRDHAERAADGARRLRPPRGSTRRHAARPRYGAAPRRSASRAPLAIGQVPSVFKRGERCELSHSDRAVPAVRFAVPVWRMRRAVCYL